MVLRKRILNVGIVFGEREGETMPKKKERLDEA